jgi:hypothetical protein
MTERGPDIFDKVRLPPELDEGLRSANPWWQGKPGRVLPVYRRWAFQAVLRRLETGLAPVIVLRGARQVGKTTLLEQVIEHLLGEKRVEPRRILRAQFDELPSLRPLSEPILAVARWFESRILGATLNEAAHARKPAYLFLDEVQNLADWAPQIKSLVDHSTVRVVVTGSSALRIEAGRDSLAGRIASLELGTLLLREIAGLREGETIQPLLGANGLQPLLEQDFWRGVEAHGLAHRFVRDGAFAVFSERGGYPLAHTRPDTVAAALADVEPLEREVGLDVLGGGRAALLASPCGAGACAWSSSARAARRSAVSRKRSEPARPREKASAASARAVKARR